MLFKIKYYSLPTRLLIFFLIFSRPHEHSYSLMTVINITDSFSQFFRYIPSESVFFVIVKTSNISAVIRFLSLLILKI